jgi:ComF family protein
LNALIHHYKFHHRFTLAPLLASALAPHIASLTPTPDLILPVPLHWLRRFRRGYDQSALLARELSRLTTIPTLHALRRVKPTPPQTTQMSRRHRAANLRGAFQVPPRLARQIQHKHLLLIDDVMTTGSTLRAAARACLAAGAASTSAAVIATAVPHQLDRPTEDRHTRTTFAPDLDP